MENPEFEIKEYFLVYSQRWRPSEYRTIKKIMDSLGGWSCLSVAQWIRQ